MALTPEQKMDAVDAVLYPPNDPDRQWDTQRDLSAVADIIGGGSRSDTEAGRAVQKIYSRLYPKEDPEAAWTADTIEEVGWIVGDYKGRFGPATDLSPSFNPAGGLVVRALVTAGLAALGITGIVMGAREIRRAEADHNPCC
jgi:hypothetical protein